MPYCDADYAAELPGRRSTTGTLVLWQGAAVMWQSKLQKTVALSTTEAEYQAAGAIARDVLWLRMLLITLREDGPGPTNIFTDSQPALALVKSPMLAQRSKHIDVVHHFARGRVLAGELTFSYINTALNPADGLTKPLPESKFKFCRDAMGLFPCRAAGEPDSGGAMK